MLLQRSVAPGPEQQQRGACELMYDSHSRPRGYRISDITVSMLEQTAITYGRLCFFT